MMITTLDEIRTTPLQWCEVQYSDDVFAALDIQDRLQTLYTSGTVFHTFLGEKLPDWKAAAKLVRTIAVNYKLPYYTLSPTYSICHNHGYIAGEVNKCPKCGEETEVYSRITGYYRPVKNWNAGKSQEYMDRKTYTFSRITTDYAAAKAKNGVSMVAGLNSAINCEITPDNLEMEHEEKKSTRNIKSQTMPKTEVKNEDSSVSGLSDGIYLFTTKTCPNCKMAKEFLNDAGIEYTMIDAEDNVELTQNYSVMQAPTLLVISEGKVHKYANASNIKKYVDAMAVLNG